MDLMESFGIFAGEASTPASGTPFLPQKEGFSADKSDKFLIGVMPSQEILHVCRHDEHSARAKKPEPPLSAEIVKIIADLVRWQGVR